MAGDGCETARAAGGAAAMPAVRRHEPGWSVAVAVLAAAALAPLVAVVVLAFGPSDGVWSHLVSTVLPRAIAETAWLMAGIGIVTGVVGVGAAWAVTMYRFPGRRVLDWALLLPLAVPTYIAAFAAVELLDFAGPVQSGLRAVLGVTSKRDYWFPEVRTLGGAVFVMGTVLYPYVYLSARATFLMQSAAALDVARTLGAGPWRLFFRVALPLARPAIAVGISLALMESLNDIGAVQYLGVRTLTVSVYDTWLNRNSLAGAAQISVAMLAAMFALVAVERAARRRQRFHAGSRAAVVVPRPLPRGRGLAVAAFCALPVVAGFVLPALVLARSALRRLDQASDPALALAGFHSISLAIVAAVSTVAAGAAVAYAVRLKPGRWPRVGAAIASIGYAVPGTVLAVGILMPLSSLDAALARTLRDLFGLAAGLMLAGSGAGLVYAYCVRFLAVPIGNVETGLGRLSPHLDMAARTLGRSAAGTLRDVLLPLLRPSIATAGLIVFVETMKELPATVLLRPFNFETLATTVFNAASRERFEDGALAALAIVAVGLVPVIVLARASAGGRNLARRQASAEIRDALQHRPA
ncbi:iron(III) transport system permease protein [Pseudoxanthobacter soli DSM 19599]|uniref:Iron(III) transport system permease protein n=1 Tax=Pseudoxanthobacter soli DSM 19599 TaxID=1123029 RepID=A0A1M7ZFR0_9HYPH|nr:iron ABC transporter permease [Pseudoxanthobacter soli]SHO63516.1 iron(III) transport system permease protein [Pseudoxanthobacter soli DSM 19599]